MIAAIIAGFTFFGQLISLGVKIWDAIQEKNDETKKAKTEILQSGLRGIIDRDPARITAAFDDLRNS